MGDLPRRALGRTGFDVTVLSYGAMEMNGHPDRGPHISEDEASAVLNAVLDSGINLIDTAPCYGLAEERIGRHVSHRRDEYFLATKCGCVSGVFSGGEHRNTAENVRAVLEESLTKLRTDHIDLVQFHQSLPPEAFDAEGALSELVALRDEGKLRFIGVSGTLPNLIDQVGMGVFETYQVPYSALQRNHENAIAAASAAGAGIIIRGGAARGAPSDWENKTYYMLPGTRMKDTWSEADLDELLNGMTRMEFTLRFTLSNPDLDTTIVGTRNLDHIRDNAEVAGHGPLPADVLEEAKRRLAAAGSAPAT